MDTKKLRTTCARGVAAVGALAIGATLFTSGGATEKKQTPDIRLEHALKELRAEPARKFTDPNYDSRREQLRIEQLFAADSATTFHDGKKYALLFNADTLAVDNKEGGTRFRNNIRNMQHSLKEAGFDEIIVLEGNGRNNQIVQGGATTTDLRRALFELQMKVSQNDLLMVYGTNHGYDAGNNGSKIALHNHEYIDDKVLMDAYSRIAARTIITLAVPCKNYFMARNTAGDNRIGISAAGPYKNAAGQFSKHFADAILCAPDENKDGYLSLGEIFRYACATNPDTKFKDLYGYRKNTPHLFYQNSNPDEIFIRKL